MYCLSVFQTCIAALVAPLAAGGAVVGLLGRVDALILVHADVVDLHVVVVAFLLPRPQPGVARAGTSRRQ